MDISDQVSFINLKDEIDKCRKNRSNMIIVTLPGLGISRMLREYQQIHVKDGVVYLEGEGEVMDYNLVNLNWEKGQEAHKLAEMFFGKLTDNRKMALVINHPYWYKQNDVVSSKYFEHSYRTYWFGIRSREDIGKMIDEIEKGVTEKEKGVIYELGGGIAHLTKWLVVNRDKLDREVETIVRDEEVVKLMKSFVEAIKTTDDEDLTELGIVDRDGYRSRIVGELMDGIELEKEFDIQVEFDLSVKENGTRSEERLTPFEANVVKEMIRTQGKISKEKVAEFKWGEGSYDEYSDQAINKAMRRLSNKLNLHYIETIPKVGYMLKEK